MTTADDDVVLLRHELAEANSEIARHHTLIQQMRSLLHRATLQVPDGSDLAGEIRFLLNREVGLPDAVEDPTGHKPVQAWVSEHRAPGLMHYHFARFIPAGPGAAERVANSIDCTATVDVDVDGNVLGVTAMIFDELDMNVIEAGDAFVVGSVFAALLQSREESGVMAFEVEPVPSADGEGPAKYIRLRMPTLFPDRTYTFGVARGE